MDARLVLVGLLTWIVSPIDLIPEFIPVLGRARILHALALASELCVCDLALLLDLSMSALSHQLRLLRERGAVTRRKAGRIAFYALADDHVRHLLTDALAHAAEPVSQTA